MITESLTDLEVFSRFRRLNLRETFSACAAESAVMTVDARNRVVFIGSNWEHAEVIVGIAGRE